MNQTEAFLAATMTRLRHAETALHNGDPDHAWRCGPTPTR